MAGRNSTAEGGLEGFARVRGGAQIESASVGAPRVEDGDAPQDALGDKRKKLEGIVDKHDDLVREMFQMEKFVNMLLYDPKTAKEDKTAVFQEYKAKYDLVDNSAPVAGPSRQTRGRIHERRQIISAPIPSSKRKAASDPRKLDGAKETPSVARGKGKAKRNIGVPQAHKEGDKDADELGSDTVTVIRRPVSPSLPTEEPTSTPSGRPKTKRHEPDLQPTTAPVNSRKGKAKLVDPAPETFLGGSVRVIRRPTAAVSSVALESDKPNGKAKSKGDVHAAEFPIPVNEDRGTRKGPSLTPRTPIPPTARIIRPSKATDPTHDPIRRKVIPAKRSALESMEHSQQDVTPCPPEPPPESISTTLKRPTGRRRVPLSSFVPPDSPVKPTIALKLAPPKAAVSVLKDALLPPPTPTPKIKRIKLIVRRPPPPLTHPKQRAPPPKYNESLTQFLTSYVSLDEEEDADIANLQQEIRHEADIREKVVQFRHQGRFIPGTDVLFGSQPHEDVYIGPPARTTRDIWDDIVSNIGKCGPAQRANSKQLSPQRVAAKVAGVIQGHFLGLETRKKRAMENEEKRVRLLAKNTGKLVTGEWKKAVLHIQEKRRLAHEEEERRLGHIHLDAILNQSGAILETQHGDLTRVTESRSRSGSIADIYGSERGDDDSDDEQETQPTGDGEDDIDDQDEIGGNVDLTTSLAVQSLYDGEDAEEAHDSGDGPEQSTADVFPDEGEEESEAADAGVGTASMLVDEPPSPSSGPPHDSRDTSPVALETRPLPTEKENTDMPSTPSPHSPPLPGNALNALHMYDDSDSDTDLADIISMNPEDSPHKSEHSEVHRMRLHDGALDLDPTPLVPPENAPTRTEGGVSVDELPSLKDSLPPTTGDSATEGLGKDEDEDTEQDIHESEHETVAESDDHDTDAPDEHEDEGQGTEEEEGPDIETPIPEHLQPYAVAPIEWNPETKITPPLLLRGVLRPYQQSGLEWLASLHTNKLNGILADEMGLGKTIQTISLLAHLACDRGIWGPHLIVVPTSVLLNWEMEFKKFLPGFKVLSYHGSQKRRKELRQGWNDKYQFNVCITSYTLASKDAHIFKRKAWYYMILDEAHMIKNFKSQRWNILLMFRSYRRLLLTGTPLQNNLTELWALLQFLMSGANFANLKEFGEWFSNPLEKAIEMGNTLDDETMQRVSKLHTVLRPYLLRRLKRDVEKELPSKFEHLTLCPLSKRQRFLYDEFMSRAQTRDALQSGIYQKIANILMQLRKVCNHPDLFEVRPIVTSFAMPQSAVASFEIKELLIRRKFLEEQDESVNLDVVGLRFINNQNVSLLAAVVSRDLDSTKTLPDFRHSEGRPPPNDSRTMAGFRKYSAYLRRANAVARWAHAGYLNKIRCSRIPIFSSETISVVEQMTTRIRPFSDIESRHNYLDTPDTVSKSVKSYATRSLEMAPLVDHFAFITPAVVAPDLPRYTLSGFTEVVEKLPLEFDAILHRAAVKKQIAFPDPSLLQYDCGKLQKLASLLREKKAGGHRVLIFTQMTRILDILEIFLNFNGYLYLRLDGATKIEDRQYITERFNADPRIFCFIASSRSGGVGINLTGADTVIFYDSDFNPQMDRQCEDRAHRIGQIRDVHIYRFVSQYTVEEAMLLKANQKRSLDDIVIQKGEFDWRSLFNDEGALTRALGDFEDAEDRHAAAIAAREEFSLVGADEADFSETDPTSVARGAMMPSEETHGDDDHDQFDGSDVDAGEDDEDDEGQGSTVDYMLAFVETEYDDFLLRLPFM